MGNQYNHLDLSERRCIYYWRHYDDLSIREMARRLGRHHSTISREIKRNSGCWCDGTVEDTHVNLDSHLHGRFKDEVHHLETTILGGL